MKFSVGVQGASKKMGRCFGGIQESPKIKGNQYFSDFNVCNYIICYYSGFYGTQEIQINQMVIFYTINTLQVIWLFIC